LDQEEQLTSNKKTQIACNYEEQGKIRSIYCEEKGVQDGDQSHPHPEAADFWEKLAVGEFWRILASLGEFSENSHFL
jgi:hypothetical protein